MNSKDQRAESPTVTLTIRIDADAHPFPNAIPSAPGYTFVRDDKLGCIASIAQAIDGKTYPVEVNDPSDYAEIRAELQKKMNASLPTVGCNQFRGFEVNPSEVNGNNWTEAATNICVHPVKSATVVLYNSNGPAGSYQLDAKGTVVS